MSGTYALVALLLVLAGMAQVVWHNGAWRKHQEAAVNVVAPSSEEADSGSVSLQEPQASRDFSRDTSSNTSAQDATRPPATSPVRAVEKKDDDQKDKPKDDKGRTNDDAKSQHSVVSSGGSTGAAADRLDARARPMPPAKKRQELARADDPVELQKRAEELRLQLGIPPRQVVETRPPQPLPEEKERREQEGSKPHPLPPAGGGRVVTPPPGDDEQQREAHIRKQKGAPLEPGPPTENRIKKDSEQHVPEEQSGEMEKGHPQQERMEIVKEPREQKELREQNEELKEAHEPQRPPKPLPVADEKKVREQRKVVRAAAKDAQELALRIAQAEARAAQKLGITPPPPKPIRRVIRQTLVKVARGEATPEEAEKEIAQELLVSGKVTSEEEAKALSQRLVEREVKEEVKAAAEELAALRKQLIRSPAQELLADSDGDGLSDFEEKVLWGTDPRNPHTAGDVLTDAERVLLGLNPLATSTDPVPVASPREMGEELPYILEVSKVAVAPAAVSEGEREASDEATMAAGESGSATTSASTSSAETTKSATAEGEGALATAHPTEERVPVATTTVGLVLEGRAIPNTTAWLYIFSTPIVVAVRADETGVWRYTLRRELPDGEHEAYVAIVNASGAIVAKSPPLRFVKEARAVTTIPSAVREEVPTPERSFLDTLRDSVWGVALIAIAVVGLLAVLVIGFWRLRAERGEQPR